MQLSFGMAMPPETMFGISIILIWDMKKPSVKTRFSAILWTAIRLWVPFPSIAMPTVFWMIAMEWIRVMVTVTTFAELLRWMKTKSIVKTREIVQRISGTTF